jgi:hypothetical protein
MSPANPLNRTSAPQIIRFFDLCFKQGVIDGCNFTDDYGAKEFVEKHKGAWDFGVLGEPDDFDWQMWRFTLYRWARYNHMTPFAENYIYKIVKKNYLWCLLPFCMRFYLMGIEEWIQYPNEAALERFKHESRIHWAPQTNSSLRKMTKSDIHSYMLQFAYEYRRAPEEVRVMNVLTMDGYCQAVHDLNQKYVKISKIRIPED